MNFDYWLQYERKQIQSHNLNLLLYIINGKRNCDYVRLCSIQEGGKIVCMMIEIDTGHTHDQYIHSMS